MKADGLDERTRAEDILLGALGFGEDARLVTIELTSAGYRGRARWSDGEETEFEYSDALDQLQRWALGVLKP